MEKAGVTWASPVLHSPRPSPQFPSPGHEVAGARGSAVVCPCLPASSAGEPRGRNGRKRSGAELHPTCQNGAEALGRRTLVSGQAGGCLVRLGQELQCEK